SHLRRPADGPPAGWQHRLVSSRAGRSGQGSGTPRGVARLSGLGRLRCTWVEQGRGQREGDSRGRSPPRQLSRAAARRTISLHPYHVELGRLPREPVAKLPLEPDSQGKATGSGGNGRGALVSVGSRRGGPARLHADGGSRKLESERGD